MRAPTGFGFLGHANLVETYQCHAGTYCLHHPSCEWRQQDSMERKYLLQVSGNDRLRRQTDASGSMWPNLHSRIIQVSAAKYMRPALTQAITQWVVVTHYRRFGKTYRSHFNGQDSWPLNMEPIGCPVTSLSNYHYSLRNSPRERSPIFIPEIITCKWI